MAPPARLAHSHERLVLAYALGNGIDDAIWLAAYANGLVVRGTCGDCVNCKYESVTLTSQQLEGLIRIADTMVAPEEDCEANYRNSGHWISHWHHHDGLLWRRAEEGRMEHVRDTSCGHDLGDAILEVADAMIEERALSCCLEPPCASVREPCLPRGLEMP